MKDIQNQCQVCWICPKFYDSTLSGSTILFVNVGFLWRTTIILFKKWNVLSTLGRLTSVTWWLGTVIIVATYTANLASLLTASRSQKSINSIEDLGSQTKIKYGKNDNDKMFSFILFISTLKKNQCISTASLQMMFFQVLLPIVLLISSSQTQIWPYIKIWRHIWRRKTL